LKDQLQKGFKAFDDLKAHKTLAEEALILKEGEVKMHLQQTASDHYSLVSGNRNRKARGRLRASLRILGR